MVGSPNRRAQRNGRKLEPVERLVIDVPKLHRHHSRNYRQPPRRNAQKSNHNPAGGSIQNSRRA